MDPKPEDPKPGSPRLVDLNRLANTPGDKVAINTPELPEEIQSRLKIEQAENEHKLRTQEAEDGHKRLISLIVHVFVLAVVTLAFLASVFVLVTLDPKTKLPDKAIGIITAIVAALLGYLTGKGSK
jgi:hypothetical protein